MKVSIVVSTYNRPERLKKAIQSVINQSYKDWELIVVHDEEKQDTTGLPTDPRISHYWIKHFGNDTKPKNFGILQSRGEYIALLDDDNEFLPDHLMVLVKFAEQNPNIDVVYGDRLVVHDDDPTFEPTVGVASDYNESLLVDRNYIDTSDVLIKREALLYVGGFDERYKKYVDWNLWVRLVKARFSFKHIAKVITRYHLHNDMKSLTVLTKGDRVGKKPFGDKAVAPVFKPEWDFFNLEIQLPYLGKIKEPTVAVFTLTKDRLEYTKIMYESLKKSGYPFTWFVVDNGSTDGTVGWLHDLIHAKDHPYMKIEVIENSKNKGISIASNQALDAIGDTYDYILKIDNDCEVGTDNWLKKLLSIYEAHRSIIVSPYVEGLVDNPGGSPRLAYKNMRGHLFGITKHIGGIFTMAYKSAYKGFRWDETDTLHSLQDTVFTQDVQKRDFVVAYIEDMRVTHIDTTKGQEEKFPEYFKKRKYEKTHVYES